MICIIITLLLVVYANHSIVTTIGARVQESDRKDTRVTLERLEQAMLDEVRALAEEARAADLAAVLAQPQP